MLQVSLFKTFIFKIEATMQFAFNNMYKFTLCE